ncbi:MAG: D-isomer specific 2-hydroxyacid dehydrogenase family protein [Actinomycetota bacterium]|nr:D-isomer specific 2-hydroxyacid dehydrogenase family protein [Actinomycetota bacterium]
MKTSPSVAIAPPGEDELRSAVEEAGGRVVEPGEADALVWTDPQDPDGLRDLLEKTSIEWVQLPFAGIEKFADAGVLGPGLTWTCTKGAYGPSCAEHAVAFMLAAARRLHVHVPARSWAGQGPERRLKGCTVLIVGTGGIGRSLVDMLGPFEARILASNRSGRPLAGAERTETSDRIPELVTEADYVVIAASLTPETKGMFNREVLEAMRPDAWIINVARGGLIDTEALVDVLRNGGIGGAALDVTDPEPLPEGHPLWAMGNVMITPHVANTWNMALPELVEMVRRNVANYAQGKELEGLVDPSLGY